MKQTTVDAICVHRIWKIASKHAEEEQILCPFLQMYRRVVYVSIEMTLFDLWIVSVYVCVCVG